MVGFGFYLWGIGEQYLTLLAVDGSPRRRDSLWRVFVLLTNGLLRVILLSFACGSQLLMAASQLQQRKEMVALQYEQETRRYNWYYRFAFKATAYSTKARVLAQCTDENGDFCDQQQLQRVVQHQVGEVMRIAGSIATYGVALSCIVLSAYGGSKFNEFLAARKHVTDAQRDFVRVFIPIITGVGVFSVGAPLWEPVKSFVRRWAFASNQVSRVEDAFAGKYPHRPELEAHWLQIQKYFSVNAQISRGTLSSFLVLITPSLQDAHRAYDEQRFDYAAAQYAKVMVQMRFLYSEITPTNPILAATVRSYLREMTPSSEFLDTVLQIALELDPLGSELDGRDYYVLCIRAWFGDDYQAPARETTPEHANAAS